MTIIPGSRVPGRTWTIRLTGHADHTVTLTCSTPTCRMPPRSRDTNAMRRFAAEHARAHARSVTVQPQADCACRAAECSLHEDTRASCFGAPMLLLVHNPAIGQVWTLAEICQACAPLISHVAVLGRAERPLAAAAAPATVPPGPAPARPVVPGGFSNPEPAPESTVKRRRPRYGGPTRLPR
ncbi:hypothetical protein ACFWHQ_23750 [Streptomyces sp. NPDC060334]|uniref:hypothetical protein n=1 Tax=Streptomyces sp. NPDC060334 TaxID=3347099 RepID=UPI003651EA19